MGWRRLTGLAGPSSNNAKRNTWAQSARREDKRITAALCQRDPLPVHPNPSTALAVRSSSMGYYALQCW